MIDTFNGCVDGMQLPEPHLCPAGDYKLSAIEEHSDYIAGVTDGFNPVACKGRCKQRILGECLLISSLPGKALRTLVDIARLAERFNMGSQSRAW